MSVMYIYIYIYSYCVVSSGLNIMCDMYIYVYIWAASLASVSSLSTSPDRTRTGAATTRISYHEFLEIKDKAPPNIQRYFRPSV